MLLFCYVQHPRYLLWNIFLFPSILQHRSFNIILCHLACCQIILLVFLKGVWFSFNGLTFCRCFCEMLGFNHVYTCHLFIVRWSPYSFYEVTHVETNIFSFQLTFWNIQTILLCVFYFQVPPLFERLKICHILIYELLWQTTYMNKNLPHF